MGQMAYTAQMAMDMYYLDAKTDEDFFSLEQFKYMVARVYTSLLEQDYVQARKVAMAEEGFADIVLQTEWLTRHTLEIQKDEDYGLYVQLPYRPLSFPFDAYGYGVQSVQSSRPSLCGSFVRTSMRDAWMNSEMPASSKVFYYVDGNRIYFSNSSCPLKKVDVWVAADISDPSFGPLGGVVPSSKEPMIIDTVVKMMKQARDGTVVGTSDDSNPNKIPQTELNPSAIK